MFLLNSLLGYTAKAWFKPLMIGLVVLVWGLAIWRVYDYIKEHGELKAEVISLNEKLVDAQTSAKANQQAFESCKATNQYNADEAELQRNRASIALSEVDRLRNKANSNVQVVNHEAQKFRQRNLDCPALDRSFRRWVQDGM